MKRIATLAIALAAFGAGTAHGQSYATDRGSAVLGGSASWNSSRTTIETNGTESSGTVSSAYLNPQALYFVRPGLAVGGTGMIGRISAGGEHQTAYGAGPAISYYFGRGERPYYPYVSANTQYMHLSQDSHAWSYGASAGAVFMLSHSVGLDAGLRFSQSREHGPIDDSTQKVRDVGVAIGFTAFTF